ncbi:hypothetical protein ESCO_005983 [Escovopsis weberi]|uniref:Uncharacterized protein n=1 Tax=Escovopsis weberi TaxID=150374 RepID=A0A0M8MZW0_ESCWE|nr:hypothetical protein ESCO_005983 [Escovopsis weberi]
MRSDSKGAGSRNMLSKPPPGSLRRPPTPEYRADDATGPAADMFVSTVSPASSPEAPRSVAAGLESKTLPSNPGGDYKRDEGFENRLRNGSVNGNGVVRNGSVNGSGVVRNGSVNGNGMVRNGSVNGNGMARNGSFSEHNMIRKASFNEHNVIRKGSFNEHNVVRKGSFNRNGVAATGPPPRRVGSKDLPGIPAQIPGSGSMTNPNLSTSKNNTNRCRCNSRCNSWKLNYNNS